LILIIASKEDLGVHLEPYSLFKYYLKYYLIIDYESALEKGLLE
jgi:hypothetical protein